MINYVREVKWNVDFKEIKSCKFLTVHGFFSFGCFEISNDEYFQFIESCKM